MAHRTMKMGFAAAKNLYGAVVRKLSQQEHPVLLKVGANDGLTNDISGEVIRKHHNWRGVMIEPVPYCFERLEKNFGGWFALEQIAIGAKPGEASFYCIPDDMQEHRRLPHWVDGLGSFDREHLVRHLGKLAPELVNEIQSITVKVDTLANVVVRHDMTRISLLHIDAEGHDYEVLKSLGDSVVPETIFIEHEHLSDDDKTEMIVKLSKTYDLFDCGSDYLAVMK